MGDMKLWNYDSQMDVTFSLYKNIKIIQFILFNIESSSRETEKVYFKFQSSWCMCVFAYVFYRLPNLSTERKLIIWDNMT